MVVDRGTVVNLPLTILDQNTLKVTVGWTPPQGVTGYRFMIDGKPLATSWDASKKQATFAIPDSQPHTYTVFAVAALAQGQITVNTAAPPPPPPPGSYPTATKRYTGGNFDAFLASLKAGDVAAIAADGHFGSALNGYASNVILQADNPGVPPKITGRLDIRGNIADWVFDTLRLDDSGVPFSTYQVSWVVGGQRIVFRRMNATNGHTKIGFEFINNSWGHAQNCVLDRSLIHQIGRILKTKPDPSLYPAAAQDATGLWHTNNDHGVYDGGTGLHIVDCIVGDCSDRGLQLRGSKQAHVEYVTVSGCGEGVIFGDIGAVGCLVEKSILVNNKVTSRKLIEEYDPSGHDSGNRVDDCFAWNADGRSPGGSSHGVSVTNLHNVNPQLGPNLLPAAGSPAVGYGCRLALT